MVLGPVSENEQAGGEDARTRDAVRRLEQLRHDGVRRSEASRLVAEMLDFPKAKVYKLALDMPWSDV